MIEYDLKDQQYKIELDSKKMEMERGIMKMTEEQQSELRKIGIINDNKKKTNKEFWINNVHLENINKANNR